MFTVLCLAAQDREWIATVRITWASADYDDPLPIVGAAVIIHLDNAQAIFFSLEEKATGSAI